MAAATLRKLRPLGPLSASTWRVAIRIWRRRSSWSTCRGIEASLHLNQVAPGLPAGSRYGLQQPLRVGLGWLVEHVVYWSALNDAPIAHDDAVFSNLPDDG